MRAAASLPWSVLQEEMKEWMEALLPGSYQRWQVRGKGEAPTTLQTALHTHTNTHTNTHTHTCTHTPFNKTSSLLLQKHVNTVAVSPSPLPPPPSPLPSLQSQQSVARQMPPHPPTAEDLPPPYNPEMARKPNSLYPPLPEK